MKKLSIQEKARRYDEAYKKVADRFGSNVADEIFTDCKESDNEKIRKELISFVNNDGWKFIKLTKEEKKSWIAWLKKQGEQKPLYIRFGDVPSNETSKIYRGEVEIGDENGVSVYPAFEVNGDIVLGLTLPITRTTLYTQQHLLEYDDRPCYLVSGDYVGKGTDGEPLIRNISIIKRLDNYRIKDFEKQGEQMPDEKAEPKFNVGDWVVDEFTGSVYQIKDCIENVSNHKYGYDLTNGGYIGSNAVNHCHLWTIQDAKPGDVLVTDSERPFIFKGCLDKMHPNSPVAYCGIASDKHFYDSGGDDWWTDKNVYPATKEQRDTLKKAMAKTGYTFDFNKKKLKKI